MENPTSRTTSASAAPAATPPAEELLKKIQELEAGHAHLKEEMSKLMTSTNDCKHDRPHQHPQRSHSISPQRSRPRRPIGGGGAFDGGVLAAWKKGSASFRHSSPLQRESRSRDFCAAGGDGNCGGGPAAVKFTDKQYLNILQSMGQAVHIFDVNCRIIYCEPQCRPTFQELVERLRDMQRQYAIQFQATRAAAVDSSQKEP